MSLQLDARQRAMLGEMGIRLWAPVPPRPAAPAVDAERAAAVPRPAPSSAPTPVPAQRPERTVARPPVAAPVAVPATTPALAPPPAGIEAMDWAELQAAVAHCRACGLCEGRTQTVFGVGSQRADWMVVGEAPGEQEDRRGEPFVGPAGQLLDQMLAAIGLSRQAEITLDSGAASTSQASAEGQNDSQKPMRRGVYIANVLKCRPPGNRNPQPDEIAQCEPYLRRQVALVQPKVILAMGRFAVQSLLNTTEPIGRLRGRVHHYAGVPVVVTYHPAYLLRALPEKAKAWQDLCLARQVFESARPAPD